MGRILDAALLLSPISMGRILNAVLLLSSIVLIIVVAAVTKRHGKLQDAKNRRFLEEEQAANLARRREIEPELFFYADLSKLPPIDERDQFKVLRTSKRKMIRFTEPKSNIDLKLNYGPSQLDSIALYEENFHDFLKSLGEWAAALAADGLTDDALQVLEYAINHGTEFRAAYKLAADIYAYEQDRAALEYLLQAAQNNHFNDPAMQEHVLQHIEDKISALGGHA